MASQKSAVLQLSAIAKTNEPTRPQIDDRREVKLAFPGLDLGDVTNPTRVHRGRFEIAFQQVRELRRRRVGLRERPTAPLAFSPQTLRPHTLRDGVDRQAVIAVFIDKLGMDPRAAALTGLLNKHLLDDLVKIVTALPGGVGVPSQCL